jgi:gliding motility-associated-like protein
VTLNLTVVPEITETIDEEICEGDSYTFDGIDRTTTGVYTATFTSAAGCDSTVTLNLTVLPEITETIDEEICEGDSYTFDGIDRTTTGVYTATFTSAAGCDSTVTLNLTVLPEITETINEEICEGNSYTFDGIDRTTTGVYTATFASAAGCDSTVTLNLTVVPEITETIDEEICEGDSYTFDGIDRTTTGVYTATFTSAAGCDSTVTLNLTVIPEITETIDEEICDGDSYTFDGIDRTTTGVYTATFTSAAGCDSTVTLNLTVVPEITETIDEEICDGDSYTFDGIDRTTTGVYTATYTSAAGCDSTVTLNLTVVPEITETIDEEICEGDSYTFDGIDRTTTGVYTATFTSAAGCDSTVTLNLTVVPEITETINEEICEGDSYTFDGIDRTTTGVYTATFTTASGCDSTVTLNLTVLPELTETINEEICEGDSYNFDGIDRTQTSTYTATFISESGCDSIVTLNLEVISIDAGFANVVCANNGTPEDPSDDVYTVQITVTSDSPRSGWTAGTISGNYNSPVLVGPLSIADGDLVLNIEDVEHPDCGISLVVTAPPPCSEDCDINAAVSNIVCDDASTPGITDDDVFYFDVSASGVNVGSAYMIIIGSQTVATGVNYGDDVQAIGPYLISDGSFTITVTDVDDPDGCPIILTVNPPPFCSVDCSMNVTTGAPVCNDNGTPSDPNDDFFTFEVTVTSTGGSTNGWVDQDGRTGEYGVAVEYGPFQISDGVVALIFTDADLTSCTSSTSVTPPLPCSEVCFLNITHLETICDVNGTPFTADDDTFTFTLRIDGGNVSTAGWTSNDPTRPSGQYGVEVTFGPYAIADGNVTVIITDRDDPTCREEIEIVAPAPCSGTCNMDAVITNLRCNDNGTPSIPNDDTYTYELTVSVGSSNGAERWSDNYGNSAPYDSTIVLGPYAISNGQRVHIITDEQFPGCFTTENVTPPTPCSNACAITALITEPPSCDDNGTPNNASDDTFYFTVVIEGANASGLGWRSNDAGKPNGTYGTPVRFGPYPISGGDVTINFSDRFNATCSTSVIAKAPQFCSNQCNITARFSNTLCDKNGTPYDPTDDQFYFMVTVTGTNTGSFYRVVGIDGTYEYGELEIIGPFDISGGRVCIEVYDHQDRNCSAIVCSDPPEPCADCLIEGTVLSVYCEDNGTPADPSDDIFYFDAIITGQNASGLGWRQTFIDATTGVTGQYGQVATFGPYNIADGPQPIRIRDKTDSACRIDFVVQPPEPCSEECDALSLTQIELCSGDSVIINGTTYKNRGTYTVFEGLAANGCDSTAQIQITLLEPEIEIIEATICDGDSYEFGGQNIRVAGTYEDIEEGGATNGCDLTRILKLEVLPNETETIEVTICEGEFYELEGRQLSTAGTHTIEKEGEAANGCKKVIIIILTVVSPDEETINVDLCEGETFMLGNIVYDQAGVYYDTLPATSGAGCDVYYTINVSVTDIVRDTIREAICKGEVYNFNGQLLTASGTYDRTIDGAGGGDCDQIEALILTVHDKVTGEINVTICIGESYEFNGTLYDQPGRYTADFPNGSSAGCDSIAVLNLDVRDVVFNEMTVDICNGESYPFGGQDLTQSGVYRDTILGGSPSGCDVVNQLTLVVHPLVDVTIQRSICEGETITFGGQVYTTSGTYTHTIDNGSQFGCDSTTTLILTVSAEVTNEMTVILCEGDTYTFAGEERSQAGTYRDTIIGGSQAGCDLINILHLEIGQAGELVENINICTGDSYTFNGVTYSSSGIYYDTIPGGAVNGCDSLLELHLLVEDAVTNVINATICDGESYIINGVSYSTTGTHEQTILNGSAAGCDSMIILHLLVEQEVIVNISATICEGEIYTVGTDTFTMSGFYPVVLPGAAANGCDSIVNLTLQVDQLVIEELFGSFCAGESYSLNGQTYTDPGVYRDTIPNGAANGCDKIVILTLEELPVARNIIEATICEGDFLEINGVLYREAGEVEAVIESGAANGCDSVVVIRLEVLPNAGSIEHVSICTGESYTFNGVSYGITGVYYDTIPGGAVNGCDSLLELHLLVESTVTNVINATICEGESYVINGVPYFTTGTFEETVDNGSSAGCDSLIILNLTVELPVTAEVTATICEGDSYTVGGETFTTPGEHPVTLAGAAANGCDSTIILTLQINQAVTEEISATFCADESYSLNGHTYTAAGVYRDTLPGESANGCDSIIVLTLEELPKPVTVINGTICDGDFFEVNGKFYFQAGEYPDVIENGAANGCDSLLIIRLEVLPKAESTENVTICAGDTYEWNGITYSVTGNYERTFENGAANGCDSTAYLVLTVLPPVVPAINGPDFFCEGSSVELTVAGSYVQYEWSTGETVSIITVSETGTYAVTVTDENGCMGSTGFAVEEVPLPVADAGADTFFYCGSATLQLDAGGSSDDVVRYQWSGPGIHGGNRNMIRPVVDQVGTYVLTVTNGNGCTDTDVVIVTEGDLPPEANAGPSRVITCDEPIVVLNGSSTSKNPIFTWSGPGINDDNRHDQQPKVGVGGVYTLVVEDAESGCISQATYVFVGVNQEAPFAVIRQEDELDCYTSVITLSASTQGEDEQYQFRWTHNGQYMGEDKSIQVSEGGWVVLTVLDTINGCPAIDSLLVIDKTEYPAANAGDPALLNCYQPTAVLSATASQAPYITYQWKGPEGGIVRGRNTLRPEVIREGLYFLTVIDTINGCNRTDSVRVTIDNSSPVAQVQDSFLLDCFDSNVMLDGSGSSSGPGISYQWITVGGQIIGRTTEQNVEISGDGLYIQSVFDVGNGCTDRDTVVVYGPLMPNSAQILTTPSCFGQSTGIIQVQEIQGGTPPYLIGLNNRPLSADSIFRDLRPGNYLLTIQDVNGCEWNTTVFVDELSPIDVRVSAETDELLLGDSVLLKGQTTIPDDFVDDLYWTPADSLSCPHCYNTWADPAYTTTYTFTVVDTLGCEGQASLTLTVDRRPRLYHPDAFSPNGDGVNDGFTIYGNSGARRILRMKIFDRWGNMVFDKEGFPLNNPDEGWDGTFRGRDMNAAVFAFWAEVLMIDNSVEFVKGDLTLVR